MKKLLRTLTVFTLAVMFTILATGCNCLTKRPVSGGGDAPIVLDAETQALLDSIDFTAGQDYTGTVSVKVVANDTERAIINGIIESFNMFYPNVTVTIDDTTMIDGYYGSLSKEYDNNLLADVFWLAQDHIDFVCSQEIKTTDAQGNEIYLPEMLLPLSYIDNLDDSVNFKNDFIEEAYNVSTYRNELFMLPRDYNQVVMYYNMDMFDAAGVNYPGKEAMSQQEFLNMLDALRTGFKNASSDKIMANGQKYNEYFNASDRTLVDVNALWDSFSWPLFKSFGGTVCDDLNSVSFDSQENLNAIKFLANMKVRNLYNSSGNPDSQFKLQERPILFHSRAVLSGLLNEVQGRKMKRLGAAPIPNFGGVEYAVGGGSSGYAMSRKAKDKTATWLFMKYIVDPSGQEAFCSTGNGVPVLKELLEAPDAMWRNVQLNGLGENFNHDAFIYGLDWELDERPFASTRDFFKYISSSCQEEFIKQMEYVLNEINVTQETAKLQTALTKAASQMEVMVTKYPKVAA